MSQAFQRLMAKAIEAHRAGKLARAEKGYRDVLAKFPGQPDALGMLGALMVQRGKAKQGLPLLEKAAAASPHPAAQVNLANAYSDLGRTEQAVERYRRALAAQPDMVEAAFNLGRNLMILERAAEAAEVLAEAQGRAPRDPAIASALARALARARRPTEAVSAFLKALELSPDDTALRDDFAEFAGHLEFTRPDPALAAEVARCLADENVESRRLARVAAALIRLDPDWEPEGDETAPILSTPLFRALLRSDIVVGADLEALLGRVRRNLLARALGEGGSAFFALAVDIALQCRANDFVWTVSEAEEEDLGKLHAGFVGSPDGELGFRAAVLASYGIVPGEGPWEHLRALDGAAELVARVHDQPAEERLLADDIQALTPIHDGVSTAVATQYEESPYPKWSGAPPVRARDLNRELAALSSDYRPIRGLEAPRNVLVAGCGTGWHAYLAARSFPKSRVLAVDLSRASLAHAVRATRAAGVGNLDFGQADILELGSLERRFEVIECGGVLHHLEDPLAGWRVLVDLLKGPGVMKIALYSKLARRDLAQAQAFVRDGGWNADADGIREARSALLALPEDDPRRKAVAVNREFYASASCRDLLFHVMEHCFTVEGLLTALDALDLNFIGFELPDPATGERFDAFHDGKRRRDDLEAWAAFEEAEPDTFAHMYQFWCRKG